LRRESHGIACRVYGSRYEIDPQAPRRANTRSTASNLITGNVTSATRKDLSGITTCGALLLWTDHQ